MKNSNIQWIGDIPDNWDVVRTKFISKFVNGYAFDSNNLLTDYNYPVIRIGDIQNSTICFDNILGVKENGGLEKYAIKENDILLAMSGATVGKVGYVNVICKAYINQRVGIIRTDYSPKFLFYCLNNNQFLEYTALQSYGSAQPNISEKAFGDYAIPLPPLATQTAIATYLDAKCSQIDGLIADINKQIETLNELKKSTITEAVTKGLNKNAKLKDSGIQWIGMIPEGWSVSRVKYLLIERKNFSIYGEEEPLSMSQKYGLIPTSEMENVPHQAATLVGSKIANVGDLVFNKLKAHLGVFSVSKYYGLVSPDYAVYYSNGKSDVKYLEFLFKTQLYISQFKKLITGVGAGLSRLYTSDLYSIHSIYPPLAEQQSIATYLDTKCSEFDSIISDKQKQISTLEAYKKSLIYEYVTGKKEVES